MLWNYLIKTGSTIVMMRTAMNDSLLVLARNIQDVYEIKYLKEEAMKIAGRDDKYIEWQARIDKRQIESLKTTCIRNFINSVPSRYNHLVKFNDWNSAMEYIDKIIEEGK
tara:strand:+ start:74 stop:403 length:330 start_codon:yes stop_codon:yes gene_type:complete